MSDSRTGLRLQALSVAAIARWRCVNLLQGAFLVSWTSLCITLALAAMALTWRPDTSLWMARHLWAPPLLRVAGVRLEVSGLEKVEGLRSAVFMANHQSMIDIAVVFAALPVGLRFVAKRVLSFIPFLGWYMWAMGMVFVDRRNRQQAIASLKRATALFESGAYVMTFPEGTRTRDGRVLPFKKGLFMLAIDAKVPIVPVALEGALDVLPTGGFSVRPGVIRVAVGDPISTAGLTADDRDALLERVRSAVIDLNVSLGGKGGDKSTPLPS